MFELNCEIINAGNPERIIFFNPLASDFTVWKSMVNFFKEDYEVVLIDYPGYGLSPYEPIQSLEWLSDKILSQLQTLDLKPTHLIGYSFGSWIAQRLATSELLNIKTLSLIGSSAHVYQLGIFMTEGWLEILETCGVDAMLKQLSYWSFHPLTFQQNPKLLNIYVRSSKKGINNIETLKDQIKAISNYQEATDLSRISVPTLILRGEYDISYPKFCSEKLIKLIKDTTYIEIEHSAHSTLWEQPKEVIKAVSTFLNKIDKKD
ncbi:alpha/beta fold hydrolase [Sporosarcina limicola]|uniref:Pimeloyl-ACP methyl ester carboxylesterase n=1 Tax=Sporosarcina limicola TaxID=34101 RepID=A0A927MIP2_9BACL|nr:alpha/beta hydrolase [Sporosarcina limicola]MBE1555424.1 pimeloyl-ACP methyl ester carboxylesterase [Sporosarcina limicola]